jgi:uncharacterized protein YlxW (UPF0749 family)
MALPPATFNRTTALLDDLLANPLDPGYRAAAAHPRPVRRWHQPMLWLGCVVVGLLIVTAYQQNHRSAPAREAANQDLISRIHALQSAGATMDGKAKVLAGEVAALRDAQLPAANNQSLRNLEIASGSVAVHGPGVVIELGEPDASATSAATGRDGTGSQQQIAVIHDVQVRSVVNQLWNSGAEAITVNGIRLTATSAIRFAGESILVDFQTINSPYTVQAIGDRNQLLLAFADSPIARQLKTAQQVLGISFDFSGRSDLRLGSVTVVQQSYASAGAATASPTPTSVPSSGAVATPSGSGAASASATGASTPNSSETSP